jgi:peptide/nickel transport system substrate-binding protein
MSKPRPKYARAPVGPLRHMRLATCAWTFWLAALAICGCAHEQEQREPGVLEITEHEQTGSFTRNFNPLLEAGDVRWVTRRAMYEPMMIYEPIRGAYVPWLATSCGFSADSSLLTCQLRENVKWSDGKPFTAADVTFTFELTRKFPACDGRGIWQYLKGVRSEGDHTVVFEFARVFVPSLFYITHQTIVPKHIWSNVKDPVTFANPNPVATGPFTEVESFQPQAYRMGRNPHYWQPGKPAVKALYFQAFPGNDQANLALLHDEIDWAGSFVPAIDRIFVETNKAHHHYWFPLIEGSVFLYPNNMKKPYDDVRVRKALSMAIDRTAIVSVAMHGYTRPGDATGLSDAYTKFRSQAAVDAGTWVKLDPEAAGKLLDEVGIKKNSKGLREYNGDVWTVHVAVPGGFSDWVRAGSLIVRSLKAVGIDAELETLDFNAWFENLQKGEYELSMGWTEVSPTPFNFYRFLMSKETALPIGEMAAENWHRGVVPESDPIFDRLEVLNDPVEEAKLYEQLQLMFVKHAPALPLFPGPSWGEYNTRGFTGFPSEKNPYAPLSPNMIPQSLLVVTEVKPR